MPWSRSLAGKWATPAIPDAERGTRGLFRLGAADHRGGNPDLFADPGRFPHGVRLGPQQQVDAHHLQVHLMVGRAGRLAAAVELDLASYAVVVVFRNRRKFRDMMPYVTAVLMVTQTFFLILITFVAKPFQMLMAGQGIIDAGDGNGLNPLLQYWTMVIHPPMLYLGFVGFSVPFAFAIGSLITKQPGDAWIHTTRRWTLVTWMFQSTGILLGAGWAYAVLGWGGYWGWDPVENGSLLPWITATAFLHSVMMQEKKGMMKVWNIVLVSSTFFLCIFSTFLTRAGIVNSVHAFAQSSIGTYFVTFLALGISGTVYLILSRLDYLKSEAQLESVLSRESSFFFNNLVSAGQLLRDSVGHAVPGHHRKR